MFYVLILLCLVVVSTLTYGVVVKGKEEIGGAKKIKRVLFTNLAAFVPVITFAMILMIPNVVHAATTGASSSNGLGYIAAALCTGLATVGTGYAVGAVGSSAVGAVSEDSKILGKTIIFVGLAEGIAIYGIIISIMILNSLG